MQPEPGSTAQHEAPLDRRPRALLTPALDVLLGGGVSILLLAGVLLFDVRPLRGSDAGALIVLTIFLNWPHFIASYCLLYRTRQSALQHRWASLYWPAALLLYGVVSVSIAGTHPIPWNLLIVFGGLYLGRHYTGQTWGVMASFAHVDGSHFDARERGLIRLGLNLIMLWHVAWAAKHSIGRVSTDWSAGANLIYAYAGWLALGGFALGLLGLLAFARRAGRAPSLRVITPWVAIHVWYLAMAGDQSALMAAQVGHALQYLIFPLRLEMNRASGAVSRPWVKPVAGLALWTLVGVAVFEGAEPVFRAGYHVAGGGGNFPAVMSTVLITCIGIHHYLIDGALYKLRNPAVRRALFAHLPAATQPKS